ncbi:MAG: hypothetical protein H0V89_03110 [Deltaproteobacteria bacterium]|nr:hypothetical protein [Deltaproteobacteria bacterium]
MRAEGNTVFFADGTQRDYDLVVCATGFSLSLPMLAPGTVDIHGKCPQLLAGTMTRHDRHLYVVGGYQARYGLGPVVRPAAVLLARWVALQDEIERPLGDALYRIGLRPPASHLVDPHAAIRSMSLAMRAMPLLRWRVRRVGSARPVVATPLGE